MLITRREEFEIEYGFQKAFKTDLPENEDMAMQAIVAWNRLWELMVKYNNFSTKFGSDIIDWQIGNWANDVCMILYNTQKYEKLIELNKQILQINWGPGEELFHENAKRDIADCYVEAGDMATAYKLYEKYISEDPLWGFGWIGYFRLLRKNKDAEFTKVLNNLYAKCKKNTKFRGIKDLLQEMGNEYEDLGEQDKAKACWRRSKQTKATR